MIDAYSSNAYNKIQNDLKIFCGKKLEIAKIQRNKAIVPNKIYLAWDTGEIFIANHAGSLYQYGSSTAAVKEIVNNTVEDIVERLNTISTTNANVNNRLTQLESNVGERLDVIVNSALERIMQSQEIKDLITTTIKSQIQTDDNFRDVLTEVIENQGFATTTELTDNINHTLKTKVIQISQGYGIQQALDAAKIGIYFCTTDYTYDDNEGHINKFTTGGFYEIYSTGLGNVSYRVIDLPQNAEDFIQPNIVIDSAKIAIPYGETLEGTTISYIIENYGNIKETTKLELRYITTDVNNSLVTINLFNDENDTTVDNRPLARESGTITITKDPIVPYGNSNLVLSGTDKQNNTFEAYIPVIGYAPLYYGTLPESSINSIVNLSRSLNEYIDRTILVSPNTGDYLYILSDHDLSIYLNGVNITNMFNKTTLDVQSGICAVTYNVYRTKTTLSNEAFTLDIRRE